MFYFLSLLSQFYLCILLGQSHVDHSALISVCFQHGKKGLGVVTTGLTPDNIFQVLFVL